MAIRKKMKNTVIVIGLLFILFLACLFPLLNLPISDCIAYLVSWFTGQERAETCSPSLTKPDSLDIFKLILLIIGGLMAAYTLILAEERQEKFSKQVDNAQAQLFNDRLGRGVELLANKSATFRVAGVRVLDDLAKTSDNSQIELIIKILFDHLKNRGYIRYKENENGDKDRGRRETRQSVELALRTILTLAHKDNISREDVIFDELDLRGLDISGVKCKLSGVIFQNILAQERNREEKTKFIRIQLKEAIFKDCDFSQASFHKAELKGAKFSEKTKLNNTHFVEANLNKAQFFDCEMNQTCFNSAELKQARFFFIDENQAHGISFQSADMKGANLSDCGLRLCDFRGAKLDGADFSNVTFWSRITRENNDGSTENMTVKNLTQTQLNTIIYGDECPPEGLPEDLHVPADRAYTVTENDERRFVTSDKDWSGKLIEEVLAYPPPHDTTSTVT